MGCRPTLDNLIFQRLSDAKRELLVSPFTEEEIKEAVWNCDNNKSPGPDGVSFSFIKKFWVDVKEDFIGFLQDFYWNGKLVRGSNCSFIVLVPKKDNPQRVSDFRPISLIGCMYKVSSKVLANRLRKVIHSLISLISESQSTFIKGRQILDGILIANKVVDDAKRKNKEVVLFKVDFEKSYDSVSWEFLEFMMIKMGFDARWRRWIRECISTPSVSVLVNGSPSEEFKVGRGLRQGDPLSPFFIPYCCRGVECNDEGNH